MTARANIYYWKCDNPIPVTEKRQLYFQDKYDREMTAAVRRACREALGGEPDDVRPAGCDGNHFAYRVDHAGRGYFFRADDGGNGDDYMLAESRLMRLAADAGVPVPEVLITELETARYGFRFQLMERIPEPCLHLHYRDGCLEVDSIARQLGGILRQLHRVELDGFGFVDTDRLRRDGCLIGLDHAWERYFDKRLDDHLGYLRDHELLSAPELEELVRLIDEHRPLLRLERGVLIHRDAALWNVLGTPERVTALIDWDDAVSGDPADDLGMLRCFYDDDFIDALLEGYGGGEPLSATLLRRSWLYCLRNMLWKIVIRDYMGYFRRDDGFFLNDGNRYRSLREYSFARLHRAMDELKR